MELQLYLDILKRRALVIAIVAVVAVAVVITAGALIKPVYTSTTTARILLDVGVVDFRLSEDYSFRLLNTYTNILKSDPILEKAINLQAPGTSLRVGDLRDKVRVQSVPNSELISISVQAGKPALARDLANALAKLLVEYAQGLYTGNSKSARQIMDDQLTSMEKDLEVDRQQMAALQAGGKTGTEVETLASQIKSKEDAYDLLLGRYEMARLNESLRANSVTIISPATLPQSPSNRLGLTQIGLGLIVGLFGGVGLALVLENVDTRIHSPQQLEHLTNLPVLGIVPKGLLSPDSFGHSNGTGSKPIEEAYRVLSLNLQALKADTTLQTVLITSAVPKEGKSVVAASLAQTLAEYNQTVFLIETDLRRPSIEKVFGVNGGLGLSSLLTERTALDSAALSNIMQPTAQPSLFVLGAGPKIANPTLLLASPPMSKLLNYLGAQGQITLLDAPPVLGVADVSTLVSKVDGVVLVVSQAQSKREQVLAALKQLQASRARVLGFVFLRDGSKNWSY